MLIAQISDPHLCAPGELYEGVVDSNAMLSAAIRQVNAFEPRPDVVILSGDLVEHATAEAYAEARRRLDALEIPLVAIPGNHDERDAFRACFADHGHLPPTGPLHVVVGDRGPVRIVGLDITVPGEHHGLVTEEAAAWLDRCLAREPDAPTIIAMHQPPFASGVPYLDAYSCRGGERLAGVVARHGAIERIVCGHVHRFMLTRFAGTTICSAPSTTTAIALRLAADAEPASFVEPPAFLLHHWSAEAGLVTHLVPIGAFPGPYAFA